MCTSSQKFENLFRPVLTSRHDLMQSIGFLELMPG